MNEIMMPAGLTLPEIANDPASYPAEVKAASLEVIKAMKAQLRDMEISISSNVINEMALDHASKILFVNSLGQEKTLTLKSAPKKLNPNIKDFEQYVIEKGFNHSQLGEIKFIPYNWAKCKEIRKQGGKIQEVIDSIYVDGQPSIEIK